MRIFRHFIILTLPIVLLAIIFSRPFSKVSAATSSLSLGKNVIGEGEDFATRELGLPWDMKSAPYPDFYTALKNIDRSSFSVSNSFWHMTAVTNDVKIWLHWTDLQLTQKVLKLGEKYPIDSDKYGLLSFYLCSDIPSKANVYWYYTGAPWSDYGISNYINIDSGCHLYEIDLRYINKFEGQWSGNPIGLRLDPVINATQFKLDWVRLTSIDTSNIVPISWSDINPNSSIYFYLSKSGCKGGDLVGYKTGGSSGIFNWGEALQPYPDEATPLPIPESFEPGNYYVYALENNQGTPICADSQLEIHKAPMLNFQKPSYFSGPDYASSIIGDPWGMSNQEDIETIKGFPTFNFDDGIFTGITSTSDHQLHLHVDQPINSDIYKYATFRFHVEGTKTPGDGRVQRFIWWYRGVTIDPVVTQDLWIYEGWHTYTLNLKEALIENGGQWVNSPTSFRFDTSETNPPVTIHVDFIKLTGDEILSAGQPFNIYFETTSENANIHFYYDNDKNPNNGRSHITEKTNILNLKNLDHLIFIPVVSKLKTTAYAQNEINLIDGQKYVWDTTGIPPGTYYVCADVDDGVMTTTWYSELPVIIK